jgi:hypothetical protein
MFQDEAGFGRINKPKYCWCMKGIRPTVPCHHIREFRYTYGANVFLQKLTAAYPNDFILMIADGTAWHKSKGL